MRAATNELESSLQQQARQPEQQHTSFYHVSAVTAGAPAIASLQDALAFPEQTPQLGPVRRRALTKLNSSSSTTSTSTTGTGTDTITSDTTADASSSRSRKRAAPAGAKSASARKKFPRGLSRFRDRLQYLEDRLRLDVNALKQEISDLELQRSLAETRALATRFDANGSAAALAREYFRVFHCGFQRFPDTNRLDVRAMQMLHTSNSSRLSPSHRSSALPASLQALQRQIAAASTQQAFLDARVDPHLAFHSFVGRGVLIEQWQRYTQSHAGLRMHAGTITVAPANDAEADDADDSSRCAVVRTTGRLSAYVTRDTLSLIFPHVLQDPALAERLIGAPIEYPFHLELRVSAAGTITAYNADVDFVGALRGVLGRLTLVSTVLRDARIVESCLIGPLDVTAAENVRDAAGAIHSDANTLLPHDATAADDAQIAPVAHATADALTLCDRWNETPRASAPPLSTAQCSPSAKTRISFLLS